MCPASVDMDGRMCLLINFSSKPGHDVKCLFVITFMNILFTGENQAPCRNWSKSEWVSFFLIITFIFLTLLSGIVP